MIKLLKYILVIISANIVKGKGIMKEISLTFKKKNSEDIDLNYLLYLPYNYQQNQLDYPLVLFLHGVGKREDNLEKVKIDGIPKWVDEDINFPFICIAPKCPKEGYWDRLELVSSLISLIEEVEDDYRVDPSRFYGTGLNMRELDKLAIA